MEPPRPFEVDLFISYAHIDNQPFSPDQKGWVSRFHESLQAMLSMRLGRPAAIWRDLKLAGNDVFANEIGAQLSDTAILVSVLTPRYIESEWCPREVQQFCKAAEQTVPVVSDNRSRIIKVIKTPVDSESPLPPVMRDVLGYPFYVFDEAGTPLELDPAFGPEMGSKYHLKVAKLAWDISQQLKTLIPIRSAAQPAGEAIATKPVVYLAECSWDQRQAREALEADLRVHGYPVLPDRQLPREEAAYLAAVEEMLARSALAVHLVGATYGAVPDGPSQRSIVILQNELAVARSRSAGLRRVIWLAEGARSDRQDQQEFIDLLNTDSDAQLGAELLVCDHERLKAAIHTELDKLQRPDRSAPPPRPADASSRLVYVICDPRDRKATLPLRKILKAHGLDVQIPVFEGDAAAVRQAGHDALVHCDAVIVFYGAGDESWKRSIDSELRKIAGYRPDNPLRHVYVCLSEPETDDKRELLELDETRVLDGLSGLAPNALDRFLATLREA
jgi:hypothetical protein